MLQISASGLVKRVRNQEFLYERGGTFYFRRAVPEDARVAFGGRTEVVHSLKTRNLAEARHRLAAFSGAFDKCLASVRQIADPTIIPSVINSPPPTKEELEAAVRSWLLARRRWEQNDFADDAEAGAEVLQTIETELQLVALSLGPGGGRLQTSSRWIAEHICAERGWDLRLQPELRSYLQREVAFGQQEAALQRRDEIEGKPRRVHDTRFTADKYARDEKSARPPISVLGLFDGYVAERKPAPATEKRWRGLVRAFETFLGHNDATRVSTADVIAWKDDLLAPRKDGTARKARTVRDAYLAALSAAMGWGAENGKIARNPALGVKVRGPKPPLLRDRGLTDAEAKVILAATLRPQSGRVSPSYARAFRWVPWLCAYTGARVNEMTQLRAEDVGKVDGVWSIRITPEAGSVKTGVARTVPMHEHLIEQGFLDVVKGRTGPLFYDPSLHRGGRDGNPQYKKVGERLAAWVRDVGVTDKAVWPNHGWRHRFKTRARECEMDAEARDVIQGHRPATEGQTTVTCRSLASTRRWRS